MPETVIARDPNALRASRLEFSYEDFAGEWRGKERDRLLAMTDALLPDSVLVILAIRVHDVTLSELTRDEWLEGVPHG